MLENIVRHLDAGKPRLRAAPDGSAEVGFTIVSMTVSLVAVFIPVLFLGGVVGRLLREFAVTISVAIVVSGLVSVVLTPMLCALFLKSGHAARSPGWFYRVTERGFDLMLRGYAVTLRWAMRLRLLMLLFSLTFVAGTAYYLVVLPKGFLPSEDTGDIHATTEGPEDVSFEGMLDAQQRVAEIVRRDEHVEALSSTVGASGPTVASNAGRMFIRLTPRASRDLTADQVIARLRKRVAAVPGIKVYFQKPPPIRPRLVEQHDDRVAPTRADGTAVEQAVQLHPVGGPERLGDRRHDPLLTGRARGGGGQGQGDDGDDGGTGVEPHGATSSVCSPGGGEFA
jgi:HAE1 family hydrophobic/amphiphilic exporter-1